MSQFSLLNTKHHDDHGDKHAEAHEELYQITRNF